mmetsp:Transcript_4195/g.13101  ORF Transcript_4195/g.13101 Transcript_4195/m.13101 type:complete len:86 (-) Transcript_4195:44-301(-)
MRLTRAALGVYKNHPDVWSSFGGWYSDPKNWRSNTAAAFAAMAGIIAPVWMYSASIEQRPIEPKFPIPSQRWCDNFGDKAYGGSK